jgi:NADH:ubiquinone reductase (H+-translocating)
MDHQACHDVTGADPRPETAALPARLEEGAPDRRGRRRRGGVGIGHRLGDRLGRRSRASIALVESARTHLWKPLLHGVAAGSIDPGEYEVNDLAQAHWHGFRHRFSEMIGLDRARVRLAAIASRSLFYLACFFPTNQVHAGPLRIFL